MKLIISGTNRAGSRTRQVAGLIQDIYTNLGESTRIIDLCEVPLSYSATQNYGGAHPEDLQGVINQVDSAEGLVVVCPEYNGSYPGALKFFIDHWSFPRSFEHRPVCLVGLGGRYGGLRPVEHLQQVFNYRNAHVFPNRVFLFNIWDQMKAGQVSAESFGLLKDQASGFVRYMAALNAAGLDANSVLARQSLEKQ